MKRKHIIVGSSIVLGGAIIFLIANRARKQKEIKNIQQAILEGKSETGTVSDLKEEITKPLTVADKKTISPARLEAIKEITTSIRTAKSGSWFMPDKEIQAISALRRIQTKEELKLVNEVVYATEKLDLIAFLESFINTESDRQEIHAILAKIK